MRTMMQRVGGVAVLGLVSGLGACGHKHTTVIEDRREPKVVERETIIERDRPSSTTYERTTESTTERR
jgi:hypothetical protein